MKKFISIFFIFLISTCCFAANWQIDYPKSILKFTAIQNGAPVTGEFKKFNAEIDFDPQQLSKSKVNLTVDLVSVYTEYPDIEETLRSKEWFNIDNFPKASFESKSFKKISEEHYEMIGDLTIRGKTTAVTIDFTFKPQGHEAKVTGSTKLQRLFYGVGQGEWQDTNAIKDDVEVTFTLIAKNK